MGEQHRREAEQDLAENRRLSLEASPTSRTKTLIAAFFVTLPAILFYTILFRRTLDIPFYDDSHVFLDFLNQLTMLKDVAAKTSYFLAAQHNEYKLFFAHGLAWLQFYLFGHIDFRMLSAIGNGFVLLLAILLWKMFLPAHKDIATRLAFFIPVSCLLFQFQYWEDLNWATASLQHITVIVFSISAIYLLVRGGLWAFCCALAFLIPAAASNANGFLLIPIGVLILALGRHYARIASWLAVSAGCAAAYAYRYNVMSSQTDSHRSVLSTLHPFRPAYIIAFIGSAGSFPFKAGCFILGILLCIFFAYMARRGYARRNPQASYSVLFLLLTAVGVAGIRSDFGVAQSLAPRYAIYSALLLIFAWLVIVEEFLQYRRAPLLKNKFYLGAVAVAVLFSLCADAMGLSMLGLRDRALFQAVVAFEHPTLPQPITGITPQLSGSEALSDAFYQRAAFNQETREMLMQSIKLGIYRPPSY
ncbi:MAG: hypothetical protein ABSC47_12140 [Terracidiphilus sp.]|jgi:hypothetical protein